MMLVIVPSRGRPDNIARLIGRFASVDPLVAQLLVVVDDDDPCRDDYVQEFQHGPLPLFNLIVGKRLRLNPTLNLHALHFANVADIDAIGFMGDDHLPQTPEWEYRIVEALSAMRTGIVYGNDLFQGPNLPTAVFMTSDIIRTLGYMSPPELVHMYMDNAWKTWGERIGRLLYLPDVIIEHLHPEAGKAPTDDRYSEVWQLMEQDRIRWEHYQETQLPADVIKLLYLLAPDGI